MRSRTFIFDPGFDSPFGHHCVSNAALVRLLPPPVYLFGTADCGKAAGLSSDVVYQKRFTESIYAADYHWKQATKSPTSYIRAIMENRLGSYFNVINSVWNEFGINRRDNVIIHTESSLLTRSLLNVFRRTPELKRPQLHVRLLLPGHEVCDDPKPYEVLADLARKKSYIRIYAELRAAKNELEKRFAFPAIELVRLALPLRETPPNRRDRVRAAGRPTITFAGEFRDEKGWQNIAPIIDAVRRMKPPVMPRFLVHGTNAQADYFRDLDNHIGRLRDTGAEVRLGALSNDDFANLLKETDAVMLPYDAEAYRLRGSGVALDAIIHGIPMVVTAGTALTEMIEDGNGVSGSGIDGLAQALKRLTDEYDGFAERAAVARERACTWLNRNAMVESAQKYANNVSEDISPRAAAGRHSILEPILGQLTRVV